MKFDELKLDSRLQEGIRKAGFTDLMEVQEKSLVLTLEGRDVFAQSQTGTGKTAAFLITILELFIQNRFRNRQAVIIVPTRELAVQIENEAKILASATDIRVGSFFGGVGYAPQQKMLAEKIEIIVGTPGRLIDLSQSHNLDFKRTSILVIDEADRLFDMGFLPDLRRMLKRMPPRSHRMTMLFSATLNTRVWQLAWEYMNQPEEIIVNPEKLTVDEITQELYHVAKAEKINLLLGVLNKSRPESALIFTNTKQGAVELAQRLSHNGLQCQFIIGDLPQRRRLQTIGELKSGKLKFLVATDVAARGLHIEDLDMVVNYDLPEDPEAYVHRIGRTARAGRRGKAVSFACERFVYSLESIESLIGMKIPVLWAEEGLFSEDKSAHIRFGAHYSHYTRRNESHRSEGRRQAGRSGGGPRGASHRSTYNSPHGHSRPANAKSDQSKHKHPAPRPHPPPRSHPAPRIQPAKSKASLEDRLRRYREKYGEEFKLSTEELAKPSAKNETKKNEGFWKRIFRPNRSKKED